MSLVLLLAVVFPALLAVLGAPRTPLRTVAHALSPWAAVPALVLSLLPGRIEPAMLDWLLLGGRLGLDLTGQVFLFFTALLWTLSGVYARAYLAHDPARQRFAVFWLLTLSGNLGLTVAQDLGTFYLSFAVMTLAAYALVVHEGGAAALRAGRVYIVMAMLAEAMLLVGFLLAAHSAAGLELGEIATGVAASPRRNLVLALLLAGFGVKAGALPLHVWLPLAHPVAPTPASAVLSGSMIKAGLLGWLRFLPLGEVALPGWGALLVGMGLTAAFFGVVIGVTQEEPKTALAYSSISQMGIINVAVGVALANPEGWPAALAATLAFAVHHGLAKGALFLGVGVAAAAESRLQRKLALAGLGLAALAVAGAPLTSGSVAKSYLKEIAPLSPAIWPEALDWLLPLTSVGTTLLMGRFLLLIARRSQLQAHHPLTAGLWAPWTLLLAAVGVVMWLLPRYYELEVDPPGLPYPGAVWVSIWPVLLGALLLWGALLASRRLNLDPGRYRIAAGDLLLPVEWVLTRGRQRLRRQEAVELEDPVVSLASRWYGVYAHSDRRDAVLRLEISLTGWGTAALLLVLLVAALFMLLR